MRFYMNLKRYFEILITSGSLLIIFLIYLNSKLFIEKSTGHDYVFICFWGAMILFAELWIMKIPELTLIHLADSLYFAVAIIFGPIVAISIALIGIPLRQIILCKRKLANDSLLYLSAKNLMGLSAGILISVILFTGGPIFANFVTATRNTLAVMIGMAVYILIDLLVDAFNIKIVNNYSSGLLNNFNVKRFYIYELFMVPVVLLSIVLFQIEKLSIILLLLPIFTVYRATKNYNELLHEAKSIINFLAADVEERAPYSMGHSERVADFSKDIAIAMGLSGEDVEHIYNAGRMHDLGKVSISDHILTKVGPLTHNEMEELRTHPEIGFNIASQLSICKDESILVKHHHERYDGRGYPEGLKGEEIPMGARILAVAEAYDAMITSHPYRKAFVFEEAIKRLEGGCFGQFDPRVVDAALRVASVKNPMVRGI